MPEPAACVLGSLAAKVVLLGDSGVGKSTLLYDIVDPVRAQQQGQRVQPTIGVDFVVKAQALKDQKRARQGTVGPCLRLHIWDVSGKERFEPLALSYLDGSKLVILFYDITNRASFLRIDHWAKKVAEMETAVGAGQCEGKTPPVGSPKLVLVGTKANLTDRREVSREEGQELAEKHNCLLFEETVATIPAGSFPQKAGEGPRVACSAGDLFAKVAELLAPQRLGSPRETPAGPIPSLGGEHAQSTRGWGWCQAPCHGAFFAPRALCRCFGFA